MSACIFEAHPPYCILQRRNDVHSISLFCAQKWGFIPAAHNDAKTACNLPSINRSTQRDSFGRCTQGCIHSGSLRGHASRLQNLLWPPFLLNLGWETTCEPGFDKHISLRAGALTSRQMHALLTISMKKGAVLSAKPKVHKAL